MAQETLSPPTLNGVLPVPQTAPVYDPLVPILERFSALPADCLEQLFADFEMAGRNHNLRGLLDVISDWSATAEVYADTTLGAELREAIDGREGIADWLPG